MTAAESQKSSKGKEFLAENKILIVFIALFIIMSILRTDAFFKDKYNKSVEADFCECDPCHRHDGCNDNRKL